MKPNKPHDSQRGYFSWYLYDFMEKYKNIILLTADLGFGQFNAIREDFPSQFYNVGASEQAMLDIAVGLAMSNKIPVCYSITPFLIYRPFETIRNYIDRESIPVKLVGGGRDRDYLHDGFSHWSEELPIVLQTFTNIRRFFPSEIEQIEEITKIMLFNDKPCFLSLRR